MGRSCTVELKVKFSKFFAWLDQSKMIIAERLKGSDNDVII